MFKNKIMLIEKCFEIDSSISSFADLGAVWGVDGIYTFYILSKYMIKKAFILDTDITETLISKAIKYPQLEVLNTNFGSDEAVNKVSKVDIIILFDVLLHQVNPDWDEILKKYASITNYFIIYNPQFNAEKTVRLLDLGREEYFTQVTHKPSDSIYYERLFTEKEKEIRDVHNIWQWGITDDSLRSVMKRLNFEEIFFLAGDKRGGPKFIDKGFIFKKNE